MAKEKTKKARVEEEEYEEEEATTEEEGSDEEESADEEEEEVEPEEEETEEETADDEDFRARAKKSAKGKVAAKEGKKVKAKKAGKKPVEVAVTKSGQVIPFRNGSVLGRCFPLVLKGAKETDIRTFAKKEKVSPSWLVQCMKSGESKLGQWKVKDDDGRIKAYAVTLRKNGSKKKAA